MNNEALKSKSGPGDCWGTPLDLWTDIYNKFLQGVSGDGPIFDPCPNMSRILPRTYGIPGKIGLSKPWGINDDRDWSSRVFVNPPFSDIAPWIQKAVEEYEIAPFNKTIIMLVPVRPDQAWWHVWVPKTQIFFIRKRVNYCREDGSVGKAPSFASCILRLSDRGHGGHEFWYPPCHVTRGFV